MLPRNLWIILLAAAASLACHLRATHNRYASTLASVMGQIRTHYVKPVDSRQLFENAMQGMVRELDPYSSFIPPDEYVQWLEELDQEFGGIGVTVQIDPELQRPRVMSPLFDSPAYRAGIRAGDIIMEIDGVDTNGLTTDDTVGMVKGPPGTRVALRILPYHKTEEVHLVLERAVVPIESVLGDTRRSDGSWEFRLADDPEIGFVRIVLFGEQTTQELKRVFTELIPQVRGLIVDLRGNQGGILDAAVETCDLFLSQGEIVREVRRGNQLQEVFRAVPGNDLIPPKMPVAILVDMFSASASEIVAACLQDHGRVVIVGQRTWGKGTVQQLLELEGGRSALRLTTANYWRPSGVNIHRRKDAKESDTWGVQPNDGYEVLLEKDAYLRMLEARRDRDAVPLARDPVSDPKGEDPAEAVDASPSEASQTSSTSERAPDSRAETEPSDHARHDPQLKKAVEFIRSKWELPPG